MKKQTVEPLRLKSEIIAVEEYLAKQNTRNRLIFTVGINSGLRVSDILALDVKDVRNKSHIELFEIKTGKRKRFPLNDKLKKLLNEFIKDKSDTEPLFKSQKGFRLDRSQVYRMLNKACQTIGIHGNIGTHTMRKTFGYHHYKQFKDIALLQMIFNHSTPQITLRYIGINQEEIDESYRQFVL